MVTSYILVSIAVVMYGFMFFTSSEYQKNCGNSLRAALVYSLCTYTTGFVILFIINKFRFELTVFSVLISLAAAVNLLIYSFCSMKSLGKINLSLYSVFAMLGGMMLPSIIGILVYGEELTVGKLICYSILIVALFMTVEKGGAKGGYGYYAGIFICNGMSGVFAKIYESAPYNKASESGYSVQIALWVIVLSSILLAFNKGEKIKINKKAIACTVGGGLLSNVGNLLQLIGLADMPASIQFPFVTGGTMIVSTVICAFTPNKPKKKEIASVIVSFAGIMVLCLFG